MGLSVLAKANGLFDDASRKQKFWSRMRILVIGKVEQVVAIWGGCFWSLAGAQM